MRYLILIPLFWTYTYHAQQERVCRLTVERGIERLGVLEDRARVYYLNEEVKCNIGGASMELVGRMVAIRNYEGHE